MKKNRLVGWRLLASLTIILAACSPEGKSPCIEEGSILYNAHISRNDSGEVYAVDLWGDKWNGQSTGAVAGNLVASRTSRTYYREGPNSLIPEDQWVTLEGGGLVTANATVWFWKWTTPQDSNETGLPDEIDLCSKGERVYRRK
jgi:hypothetical protein